MNSPLNRLKSNAWNRWGKKLSDLTDTQLDHSIKLSQVNSQTFRHVSMEQTIFGQAFYYLPSFSKIVSKQIKVDMGAINEN